METMLENITSKSNLSKCKISKRKSVGKIISLSSIQNAVIIVLLFPVAKHSSTRLYDQLISLYDNRILDQPLGTRN